MPYAILRRRVNKIIAKSNSNCENMFQKNVEIEEKSAKKIVKNREEKIKVIVFKVKHIKVCPKENS